MKTFDSVLIECGVAMFAVLFSQFCFLHGTHMSNTQWLLIITVLMQLTIVIYFVVSLMQVAYGLIKSIKPHNHKIA